MMTKGHGVIGMVAVVAACAAPDASVGTQRQNAPEVYIATMSQARATNPAAMVGDEHNWLLAQGIAEAKRLKVGALSATQKCRWLASFVLREAARSDAPTFMRQYWNKNSKLRESAFLKASSRAGCRATDVAGLTVAAAPSTMGRQSITTEDTVDYEPSPEAASYFASLEGGVYTHATPAAYDAFVAGVQGQASGLWDLDAVLATASTSVSSAYQWQAQGGGGYTDPWVDELDQRPASGPVSFGRVSMDDDVRSIIVGDVGGCVAGFWGGRSEIRRAVFGTIVRLLIPGKIWADCAAYAAIGSLTVYLS